MDLPKRRGWRYFATRLNGDGTETLLHPDVPLESVEVEDVLSGDNAVTGTIEPAVANMKQADGQPLLREWSSAVYAECDGEIRGGGIVTHSGFEGPQWQVECTGFTGYGRDLPWTAGKVVTNTPPGWNIPAGKDGGGYGIGVDPIDMARVIWKNIQDFDGGNLGLTFDLVTTKGAVKIGTALTNAVYDPGGGGATQTLEAGPFRLNWYESFDLQGIFDDLATSTPFDYHEKHSWNADGTIKHFVEIGYPKIGRRHNNLRFTFGVNIFDPIGVERNGENYSSGVIVIGSGDSSAAKHAILEPPGGRDGRLRRLAVIQDSTIKSDVAAKQRASMEAKWRSQLDDISTVAVRDHPNAPLGAVSVGDEIYINGRDDWVDVGQWVRVMAIRISPEDGKVAEYDLARTDKFVPAPVPYSTS